MYPIKIYIIVETYIEPTMEGPSEPMFQVVKAFAKKSEAETYLIKLGGQYSSYEVQECDLDDVGWETGGT